MKQSIDIWKMPFVVKSAFPGQQTQAINPSSNVVLQCLQETNIQGLDYWAPRGGTQDFKWQGWSKDFLGLRFSSPGVFWLAWFE